ncbi:DUF6447 family protein [Pseudoduganella namucuonensis]|uniref:Uncharacterized protein n=1 Tax=Pseudoduganella namucuonensis TaxID=1035707 RepID=A0A1I7FRR5_9BURK|nr:DUF6447 family protein [Pseudoduganella namucuonensis]SFU38897.1 hypothetical protein SAMN05216552_1002242 [Pseudoduganella namucuonensis]
MDEVEEVTVDGVSYRVSELSAEAREQVNNLKFVETEMAALNSRLAVYTTARNAYEQALRAALPRSIQ